MKGTIVLSVLITFVPGLLSAQEEGTRRVGIHELQADEHCWDAVRTDPAVPGFALGKQLAIEGRYHEAELEFRTGLEIRRAVAQFNMGLLDFNQAKYWNACTHFRTAYRMKRDTVFRDYLRDARRLARGRTGSR
jgi:hypothetical protein